MIGTALALAARGLHVFPCRPRDKRPATANGLKAGTVDQVIIRQWWRQQPDCNIGIATGQVSGIFVLDIDGDKGESGLSRLEREFGELPATVESITGGGGRHLFFCCPERPVRNSVSVLAAGIDIRGDGGYIVSPPSIHPSGRPYCWSVDFAAAIAIAPDWLLARITERANGNATVTPPSVWRALVSDSISEGTRDNSLAKLTGYLLRRRIDAVVVRELIQALNATKCSPPLPPGDVTRIVDSIAAAELRRRQSYGG